MKRHTIIAGLAGAFSAAAYGGLLAASWIERDRQRREWLHLVERAYPNMNRGSQRDLAQSLADGRDGSLTDPAIGPSIVARLMETLRSGSR